MMKQNSLRYKEHYRYNKYIQMEKTDNVKFCDSNEKIDCSGDCLIKKDCQNENKECKCLERYKKIEEQKLKFGCKNYYMERKQWWCPVEANETLVVEKEASFNLWRNGE
ncbi:uncharacterized protein LOC142322783 [Lycorma delicatula]|uniref:uncharacterized protein LOC142322783 n=1 Tax=Lycorma delicatula TaxID=130591 RepID=UPI003F513694